MAGRYARAISMDFHDSSDDEAILFEDVDDSDSDTVEDAAKSVSPHPISSLAGAFEESISDSAEQVRTGKPPLQFSSLTAEERRERLLSGEEYNDTYNAMWKEDAESKFHPLRKIIAQIAYGVHLLHCQGAISDQEVIRILQRHIDEVDEFIRRADEDIGMALSDIEGRVSQLKFVLDTETMFDQMLEDRKYRMEVLHGNEIIENIIKRTASLMTDLLADIKCGSESIREMSAYMAKIGPTWPPKVDIGLHDTMLANTEGWLECFEDLSIEGNILGLRLTQLGRSVNEMANRASSASRRQALVNKSPTAYNHVSSLSQESKTLSPSSAAFPVRGSSSQSSTKVLPTSSETPFPPFNDAHSSTSTLTITPEIYHQPSEDFQLKRRKTNISEKRATAISDKRASTATIASLFVPLVDDAPAVPDIPKNPSVKKSKIPKLPKIKRPRRISISEKFSFTGRSRSSSNAKKGKHTPDQLHNLGQISADSAQLVATSEARAQDFDALSVATSPSKQVEASLNQLDTPLSHASSQVESSAKHTDASVLPHVDLTRSKSPENSIGYQSDKNTVQSPAGNSSRVQSPSIVEPEPSAPVVQPLTPAEQISPTLLTPLGISIPGSRSPSSPNAPSMKIKRKPLPSSASAHSSASTTPKPSSSPSPSLHAPVAQDQTLEAPDVETRQDLRQSTSSASCRSFATPLSPTTTASRPESAESLSITTLERPIEIHRQRANSTTVSVEKPRVVEVSKPPAKAAPVEMTESPIIKPGPPLDSLSDSSSTSSVATPDIALSLQHIRSSSQQSEVMLKDITLGDKAFAAKLSTNSEHGYTAGLGIELPGAAATEQSTAAELNSSSQAKPPYEPAVDALVDRNEPDPSSSTSGKTSPAPTASKPAANHNMPPSIDLPILDSTPVHSRNSSQSLSGPTKEEQAQHTSIPDAAQSMQADCGDGVFTLSGERPESPRFAIKSSTTHSSMNKALPPLPPASESDGEISRPNSRRANSPKPDSLLSGLSQSISHSHDSMGFVPSPMTSSPRPSSSRSHAPRSIDIKITGKRAMSPLAHDSAFSTTGSFPDTPRDNEIFTRPTTSRSMKPLSRSKLALFPTTSPSMVDLRMKSDHALSSKERAMTDVDDGIGEEAESALPGPPPRLVPRKRDGGRTAPVGGMGTKLKKLMGFGRKSGKTVGVKVKRMV